MIILFQLSEVHGTNVTALFDKYSHSIARTAHCTLLRCLGACLDVNVRPSLIRDYSVLEKIYNSCILMTLPSRASASAEEHHKAP